MDSEIEISTTGNILPLTNDRSITVQNIDGQTLLLHIPLLSDICDGTLTPYYSDFILRKAALRAFIKYILADDTTQALLALIQPPIETTKSVVPNESDVMRLMREQGW